MLTPIVLGGVWENAALEERDNANAAIAAALEYFIMKPLVAHIICALNKIGTVAKRNLRLQVLTED
ncbi:MAG: hypothetical protein ABWY49_00745 [Rhizobium sp.]